MIVLSVISFTLLVGVAVAAVLWIAATLNEMNAGWECSWMDDDCPSGHCVHPRGDHQMDGPDGPCWRVGCPCRGLT